MRRLKNKIKCGWNIKAVNHTKVVRPFMRCIVSMKWKKENNYEYRKIKLDDLIDTVKHEQDLYEIIMLDLKIYKS